MMHLKRVDVEKELRVEVLNQQGNDQEDIKKLIIHIMKVNYNNCLTIYHVFLYKIEN